MMKKRKRKKGFWKVTLFFISSFFVGFLINIYFKKYLLLQIWLVYCILRVRTVSNSWNFELNLFSIIEIVIKYKKYNSNC